ncbi:hypothetical protein [Streptomyces sp. cg2]|uniref:hypothetical protein n=1 Tax=Streptomyces sp. cg2 TaxID=3238799 RepID=UPI0034E1C5D7
MAADDSSMPRYTSARIELKQGEFSAHAFIPPNQLADNVQPHTAVRVLSALRTLKAGSGIELLEGTPPHTQHR